jgi:hypothetical protein
MVVVVTMRKAIQAGHASLRHEEGETSRCHRALKTMKTEGMRWEKKDAAGAGSADGEHGVV